MRDWRDGGLLAAPAGVCARKEGVFCKKQIAAIDAGLKVKTCTFQVHKTKNLGQILPHKSRLEALGILHSSVYLLGFTLLLTLP